MDKKTIMLVCAAGLSTSILVTNMKKYAANNDFNVEVFATGTSQFDTNIKEKSVDVVLLGPQVRFMKDEFEKRLTEKRIPIAVIDMKDYGSMDGEKVLNQAFKMMD
ncbi:PTS sugar transporter subunit IIB [Aerococcus urinae]|uniref:PTS sugar transporter subunit IIB n=1 Tax=Aerococcus TaxID=1375 RepID=UPI0018A75436|nr:MULTISPECIES: PTS sugar transporter subunit IIB [Aerococcus]MCY3036268.1 PTS sugar transporter subunit IIB [Aerococcus sp. Group 2]MDK6520282.1 PTS sugar transporter subunit IIB [Aerococcus urinae]